MPKKRLPPAKDFKPSKKVNEDFRGFAEERQEPSGAAAIRIAKSLTVTVLCDLCASPCAVFELLAGGVPRGEGPEHPLRKLDSRWVYVRTFERGGDKEISAKEYDRLYAALVSRDFDALGELNWRNVVFWCRECQRCYCIVHWQISYPKDDPMCSEFGVCPKGHGTILDD
jgi:hypothetical protein